MRNGARRNVIDIEIQREVGKDNLRQPIMAWTKWRTGLFVEMTPIRGREVFDDGGKQRVASGLFRFRCSFYDVIEVSASMRIDFEGQKLNILAVKPDYLRKEDCVIEAELLDGTASVGPTGTLNFSVGSASTAAAAI